MAYCRLLDDDLPDPYCDFCGARLQRDCLDEFYWVCEHRDGLTEDDEEGWLFAPLDGDEFWNEGDTDVWA